MPPLEVKSNHHEVTYLDAFRTQMNSKFPKTVNATKKRLVAEVENSLQSLRRESATQANTNNLPLRSEENAELTEPESLAKSAYGIQNIRSALLSYIKTGELGFVVIETILDNDHFVPIEGVLLDYKRDVPTDRYSECKLIKHIQAFHNTYGGYLVVGAEEIEKDNTIAPISKQLAGIEPKKLRDLCREYFSFPIEVQCKIHEINTSNGVFAVQLIHIPKRLSSEPVFTRKEGAKDSKGKPAFLAEQAMIRDGDNSIAASTIGHWRLLYGDRHPPYGQTKVNDLEPRPIWNNLPERGYICEEFIGRQDVLSSLFGWLADDFSCVKVLAGEGGLGKTSVAFQFASEVARSRMIEADSVVWLTAKRLQFRAMLNEYEELAGPHFSTCRELFEELARNMGATEEEVATAVDLTFPRLLRKLGAHSKIFAVIDDLDSLEIDEQKRSIECCQQLAGLGSRFLFTTRKNATASTSTALELHGLTKEEFPLLVNSWCERLGTLPFSTKDLDRIWETTKGSPMYTESLLRLVKGGMSIGEANAKWRGNLGIEVRNAALKREVKQLPTEARKVLVTVAILGECSIAEIKQATEYSDTTIVDATNELQSLFLVHSPAIAEQKRFAVSNTTRELVMSLGPELVSTFGAYSEKLTANRFKAKGNFNLAKTVGTAINQASALLAARQFDDALKTIDEVNARLAGKNADLLFMRGRVLLRFPTDRLVEASTAFAKAFDLGQRKPLFFNLWMEVEMRLKHYERAVDVATEALSASVPSRADWFCYRANARMYSAASQETRGDIEHMTTQLSAAADDLVSAAELETELRWESKWQETIYRVHDKLWTGVANTSSQGNTWVTALDTQIKAIERGDQRCENYVRLASALSSMNRNATNTRNKRSDRELNLLSQSTRRAAQVFATAPKGLSLYSQFKDAKKSVGGYAEEFGIRGGFTS